MLRAIVCCGAIVCGEPAQLARPTLLRVTAPTGVKRAVPASQPVRRARELTDDLIRPSAEVVDASVVRREHLDAWAAAGLFGLAGPVSHGGAAAPAPVVREVSALLAGASGATWFVVAQHATPVASLAASTNWALRDRLLPQLCSGQQLGGIALAHLRRPGPPALTATRTSSGWRFDGHVSWLTGWGFIDVVLLHGTTADDQVVAAVVPARASSALCPSEPLQLAAMQASVTVTVDVVGLEVDDADVVAVLPLDDWRTFDAAKTANAGAHTFGVQRECVRRLQQRAAERSDGTAAALAHQLQHEGERLRRVADTLLDDVPPGEHLDDRLAVRASALELAVRSATALVAATGGSGMASGAAPQRLAREALFGLVQAQTPPVREATLRLLREAS